MYLSFVLSLIIGGISGYYGGWIDSLLQMFTDAIRTVPPIPLFMCLAAFAPLEWSSELRFFFISCLLGLISWPTLARRVRTHLLSERSQEYILAAKMCGASSTHIIIRHLLPSFTSYIIVDLVISFPYMLLSETALSFIGLGLREPVNSLGVLLQNATKADVLLNYQWYFIPVFFLSCFNINICICRRWSSRCCRSTQNKTLKFMTHLLEINNLDVKFDTDEGRITAIDNVSLTLDQGKFWVLLVSQDLVNLLQLNL